MKIEELRIYKNLSKHKRKIIDNHNWAEIDKYYDISGYKQRYMRIFICSKCKTYFEIWSNDKHGQWTYFYNSENEHVVTNSFKKILKMNCDEIIIKNLLK